MTDHFFVLSEGMIGLRTNVEDLNISYGVHPPPSTQDAYERCTVRVTLRVGDIPDFPADDEIEGRYHHFRADFGKDVLYYRRTFLFNSELKLKVQGLLTDDPIIYANQTYYRFIQQRFMNLHSVGYILVDMICYLLLRKGFAPLHCSAIRKDGATAVIFAPPNGGKTLTAMMLCMNHGADFIAEDIALTDGHTVYSVPWTSTFRHYSSVDNSLSARLLGGLKRVIPIFELVPIQKKPIGAYVSKDHMAACGDLTHIIVLERSDNRGMEEVTPEENLRKMTNLNRYGFAYCHSPLLMAYEFFNPDLMLNASREEESKLLQTIVNYSKRNIVLRSLNPLEYADILLSVLQKT